jgi:hypothetical protein
VILGINLQSRSCYVSILLATLALAAGELTAMAWLAPVQAAGNGNIGASSTGDIRINVRKQSSVQAVVPSDLVIQALGEAESNVIWVGDVFINSVRSSGYEVTATGGGDHGEFVLSGGVSQIPIDVAWSDSKASMNKKKVFTLEPGVPQSIEAKPSSERSTGSCRNERLCNPAQLIVRIPKSTSPTMKSVPLSQSLTLVIAMN